MKRIVLTFMISKVTLCCKVIYASFFFVSVTNIGKKFFRWNILGAAFTYPSNFF